MADPTVDWNGAPVISNLMRQYRYRAPGDYKPLVMGDLRGVRGTTIEVLGMDVRGAHPGTGEIMDEVTGRITDLNPSVTWNRSDRRLTREFEDHVSRFTGPLRLMEWCGVFSTRAGDVAPDPTTGSYNHTHAPDEERRMPEYPGVEWSDQYGVPWEELARMAERYETWLCIPTHASTEQARQLGRVIGRRAFHPVWIEWSNELWHGGFPQGVVVGRDPVRAARRALELCNAFRDGFREENTTAEVWRVFAWQLGGDGGPLFEFRLNPWDNFRPVNPEARALLSQFDALGVAPYAEDLSAVSVENLHAPLRVARDLADQLGIELVAYEAGFNGGTRDEHRGTLAHTLMTSLLDVLEEYCDAACLYELQYPGSDQHGHWGLVEHWFDGLSPKWLAVNEWLGVGGGGELDQRVRDLERQVAELEIVTEQLSRRLDNVGDAARGDD